MNSRFTGNLYSPNFSDLNRAHSGVYVQINRESFVEFRLLNSVRIAHF
jgi:hypothetical protein